jgi:hypothetical protein
VDPTERLTLLLLLLLGQCSSTRRLVCELGDALVESSGGRENLLVLGEGNASEARGAQQGRVLQENKCG